MNRLKITIIFILAVTLFLGSVFVYLRRDGRYVDDGPEVEGEHYSNEEYGYSLIYPLGWDVREKETRAMFPLISRDSLPQFDGDFETYRQVFRADLEGRSPLTYIEGKIDYSIEKHLYLNTNDFTIRQWYDIAALTDAYSQKKITEGEFIRMSNEVLNRGEVKTSREKIFDPWVSRGEIITVGGKEVLKATSYAKARYDGYQYYITALGDYFFVFRFGYGGAVIPREMWQRSDGHVKNMIRSLRLF